jgi:predicted aldo/keto reductase-like oxidoreductase
MIYRRLGRTEIKVSEIGLGTEYLNKKPAKTVISVIHEAIDRGVNYFDVVFAFPEYRDNLGRAFKGLRDRIIIAGHISCGELNGQYRLTRNVRENEILFNDLLKRFDTDYADIVMIQMVNNPENYEEIMKRDGLMELAHRFVKEGKAKFIGISGHKSPVLLKFVSEGLIDVLMFPINIAWNLMPGRAEVLENCTKKDVGLVAMKIFGGGRFFNKDNEKSLTIIQCMSYVLSQNSVATVVPGVKNLRELNDSLKYLEASNKEKEFNSVISYFQEDLKGNCVYCNHCLPCPQKIDIGRVIQMVDRISNRRIYKEYQKKINFYYPGRIRTGTSKMKGLSKDASKCIECGLCLKRCPFGVDIISKIKQAVNLFNQ